MDAMTSGATPFRPDLVQRNEWTVTWFPARPARFRLFCLPHAGGGAATYRAWARLLSPRVEVVAVRPPGRESRLREAPLTSAYDIAEQLAPALGPQLDVPFAVLGHSMGALLAYETCRELRRLGMAEPSRLIVSGNPSPERTQNRPPVHDQAPETVLARLKELSGTPGEVLDDPGLVAMILPLLRADFAVVENYRWRPGPALDYPISILGGDDDFSAAVEDLEGWRAFSTEECVLRTFPGGHFYLHGTPAEQDVLRHLAGELRAAGVS